MYIMSELRLHHWRPYRSTQGKVCFWTEEWYVQHKSGCILHRQGVESEGEISSEIFVLGTGGRVERHCSSVRFAVVSDTSCDGLIRPTGRRNTEYKWYFT